jgi:hypothetical protein
MNIWEMALLFRNHWFNIRNKVKTPLATTLVLVTGLVFLVKSILNLKFKETTRE